MKVTAEIVLVALRALPAYPDQGDAAERDALLRPVAEVIVEATGGDLARASSLVAIGNAESAFARYVLEGRCKDGPKGARCDWNYRTRRNESRGPWQIKDWCRQSWDHPEGSRDALLGEAKCADQLVRRAWAKCRTLDGIYAGYATGTRSCEWKHANRRRKVAAFAQIVMTRELKKGER